MFLFTLLAAALAGTSPGINGVELIQHFQLDEPMSYHWRADAPDIKEGTLLVIDVDEQQARPRQTAGPGLFVGDTLAATTHPGHTNGRMVVFVPGRVDLKHTPIFWANSDLAERTTQADARKLAESVSVTRLSSQAINGAQIPGIHVSSETQLYVHIADLIERYAPADADFAKGYRLAGEMAGQQ